MSKTTKASYEELKLKTDALIKALENLLYASYDAAMEEHSESAQTLTRARIRARATLVYVTKGMKP